MSIIPVLLVIFGTIGDRGSARWVTVEDFDPSELANLTPQKEHELMLQKLAKKEERFLVTAFNYEILANSIGNSFFQLQQDTNAIRENNAIIKAMFECTKNLLIQYRVYRTLYSVSVNGAEYVRTFGSFPLAFSLVCGDIDHALKNETFYRELRDKYKKQSYSPPNKIYHYGIAKSLKAEIEAVEELLNEPKMKPTAVHMAWVWIMDSHNSTIKDIKDSIMSLAKVPDKFEQVQKIYEQSIDEVIPLVKRLDISIFAPDAKSLYFDYLQFNLTKNIWSRIMEEIPDWKDYFECDTTDDIDDGPRRSPTKLKNVGRGRCEKTQVGKDLIYKSAWPVTTELRPFDLQNLTLQQEHEVFLKKLVSDHFKKISVFLYLELLAKSMGNDFFGLIKDEKSNIRNNAIVKAAFECISSLKLQKHAVSTISSGLKVGSTYVAGTDDIKQGFVEICSSIDNVLKNETLYTVKRNEYMKQNLSVPKRTYQYSFGKPTEDQRKVIAELYNDNLTKKILLHTLWMSIELPKTHKSEEAKTKYSILELVKVPSKSEIVQRIYEQSIEETVPQMRNFTYKEILRNENSPTVVVADYELADKFHYSGLLTKLIVSKVNQHPDLAAIFKAIGQHYEMSVAKQTTEEVIVQLGQRIFR